jgi:hypothetical protein
MSSYNIAVFQCTEWETVTKSRAFEISVDWVKCVFADGSPGFVVMDDGTKTEHANARAAMRHAVRRFHHYDAENARDCAAYLAKLRSEKT